MGRQYPKNKSFEHFLEKFGCYHMQSSRGRLYDVSKEDWNGSGNMAKILVG